jgi:hypothetical protein
MSNQQYNQVRFVQQEPDYSNIVEKYNKGINEIKESLLKRLDESANYTADLYTTIIYYIIVVGIMFFFIYIILSDLYNTFKLHNIQNSDIKRNKNNIVYDDNYNYDIDALEKNNNESIMTSIKNKDNSISNEFSKLIQFKQKHDLNDNLYINSTLDTLSSKDDNYYYPNKKSTGFWKLLFDKPKHTNIVNNSHDSYISFT